jgi:hypothetical protein
MIRIAATLLILALVLAAGACRSGPVPLDGAGIQALLDRAKAEHRREVVIPPGTYQLPVPAADAGWHLRLADCDDLAIIADGVTLVVPDEFKPTLMIERCQRVSLRGATFVRPQMIHSQGAVVAVAADRRALDVRVAAGYPQELDDAKRFGRIPVLNLFEPGARRWKAVPDLYVARHERLDAGLFRFHLRQAADPAWDVAVGDRAAWRGQSGWGHDLCLRWTEGLVLERVTVQNGAGMCFQELCGGGGNRYQDCVITYGDRPAGALEDPLLASSVDGLHSSGMKRGPQIIGCTFDGLNDDGIAIHGNYALAMRVAGGRVVVDSRPIHRGPPESPFCQVGDRVRLLAPDMTVAGELTVTAVAALPAGWRPETYPATNSRSFQNHEAARCTELSFAGALPAAVAAGCYLENIDAVGEGFLVRGCTLRDKRGHGLFLKAGGTVEDTLVENNLMGGIVVAPEVDAWTESAYAVGLVLRNNTLRRCGIGNQDWNGAITVAAFEGGRYLPLPGGHRDVRIEGNRFEDNDCANLVLSSIQGLRLAGNVFVRPMQAPVPMPRSGVESGALVWIAGCAGVEASGNRVEQAGSQLRRRVAGPDAALVQAVEGGFSDVR